MKATKTTEYTIWNDWTGRLEEKYYSFSDAMEALLEWNKETDLATAFPKSNWTIETLKKCGTKNQIIFKVSSKRLNS